MTASLKRRIAKLESKLDHDEVDQQFSKLSIPDRNIWLALRICAILAEVKSGRRTIPPELEPFCSLVDHS